VAKGGPSSTASPGAPGRRDALPGRITGAVRGVGSSKRGSQLIVAGGALLLLVILGILAIGGVFSSDDGSSAGTSDTTASADNLVIVRLAPVDGDTGASGQAVIAQTRDQPLLQVNLTGLQPTGKGQVYVVWFYGSDNAAFPVARDQVTEDGNLTGNTAIPNNVVPLLGQFGCLDVSLASASETLRAVKEALRGNSVPHLTGASVLRGQIPAAPGQTAPSGADSQCEVAAPTGGGNGGASGSGGGTGTTTKP
jgi:hypothetical protein